MAGDRKVIYVAPLVVCLALAVFWKCLTFDFVTFDDGIHIYQNQWLRPPTWDSVRRFWTAPLNGLYVPLTYTAWAAVAKFAGSGEAGPYHLLNVVVHAANVGLIFLLLWRRGGRLFPAVAGGLLFAWHPLQVEAVAWVSALKDLLSAFGVLVALHAYLSFIESRKRSTYLLATIAFLLALLAKPSAVVFPLLAALLDPRPWRESWRAWTPWCVAAIPLILVTKPLQPDSALSFTPAWYLRPFIAAHAICFYLAKLCFPVFLSLNYGHTPERVLQSPLVYFAWLVPLLIGLRTWRRGFGVFVVALLPVLGLVPFYYQTYSTVADRYLYLAMLGPALLLSKLNGRVFPAAAVLACGVLTVLQLEVWRDNRTLIRQVARVNAHDADVQYALAVVLSEDSQLPESRSFYSNLLSLRPEERNEISRNARENEAILRYREAIRINPRHAFAHNNLGLILHRQSRFAEAEKEFRAALAIEPRLAQAWNNLGAALAEQGKYADARVAFGKARELAPQDTSIRANLDAAIRQGDG